MQKLILVVVFGFLLGGCALTQYLPGRGDAAKDTQESMIVEDSPTPSLSTQNDASNLESDLDATVILDEDFSDLN